MIQITRTEHGIDDIQIDSQSLATDDGELFTVPRPLLAGTPVRGLPAGARFAVCAPRAWGLSVHVLFHQRDK